MRQTLSARVFGLYLIVVLIGLLIIGVATGIALVRYDNINAAERVQLAARIAAAAHEYYERAMPTEITGAAPVGHIEDGAGGEIDLTILSLDRPPEIASGSDRIGRFLSEIDVEELDDSGVQRSQAGSRYVYAIVPIVQRPDESEPARVVLGLTELTGVSSISNLILALSLTLAGVLVTALALYIRGVLVWIKHPVEWIKSTARTYSEGRRDVLPVPPGPDELVTAAQSLNTMASELENRLEAISEQRNQLEAILSSMVEGVIVLDRGREILSMNTAAGQLLNVSPEESNGRTLIEYLRNAQLDELAEDADESEQPVERTVTLYRDRPLHLQVHASALRRDEDGSASGTLLVMNDITRLQHLEDLRKDFVANVSHELKTPITSIKGFVETLLDGAVEEPENARRFLGIILNHADRLHAIIEDLLSLSRLEQADQRITFYEFPLRSLVESAVDLCSPRAEAKAISVTFSHTGEDHAWGNPNLLEQALVNLIDNAIKYSSEGSSVEIHASCEEETLVITVVDHGQGIRSRDLPRIFERFYRTDKARSRELGGTGLGLAIVKHIARAHLGEVTVKSLLGEGSTFSLEIPQLRSDAELRADDSSALTEWDALE